MSCACKRTRYAALLIDLPTLLQATRAEDEGNEFVGAQEQGSQKGLVQRKFIIATNRHQIHPMTTDTIETQAVRSNGHLKRIAASFRSGVLGGRVSDMMCRVVCLPLCGYLNALGIECEVITGEFLGADHSWIALPDGRIIDPTLDQFSGNVVKLPRVYVGQPMPQHKTL